MLGSLILYLKGMKTTMFQLSGFYCIVSKVRSSLTGEAQRGLALHPDIETDSSRWVPFNH